MKQLRAFVQRRTGAAAVELAFIFPLLLTVLLGIIEVGWLFMARQMVHHAAAEATRLATLPGYESTIEGPDPVLKNWVDAILANSLNLTATDITLFRNPATAGIDPCEAITVTVPNGAVMLPGFVLRSMNFDSGTTEFTVQRVHPDYAAQVVGITCQ